MAAFLTESTVCLPVVFAVGVIVIFELLAADGVAMTRTISIFGATGSVGLSTLDLVRQHRDAYRVVALTANGTCGGSWRRWRRNLAPSLRWWPMRRPIRL